MKNPTAVDLGRAGGKAGTGKSKRRGSGACDRELALKAQAKRKGKAVA